jgi:transcriptional regulator
MALSNEQRAEVLRQAWELRLGGWSHNDIARKLGITRHLVTEVLTQHRKELEEYVLASATEERKEAAARLDQLLQSVWTQAKEGDLKAVSTVLSIEERRAKLQGLDAVQKSAVDLTSGGEPLQFVVTIPRVARVDEVE